MWSTLQRVPMIFGAPVSVISICSTETATGISVQSLPDPLTVEDHSNLIHVDLRCKRESGAAIHVPRQRRHRVGGAAGDGEPERFFDRLVAMQGGCETAGEGVAGAYGADGFDFGGVGAKTV